MALQIDDFTDLSFALIQEVGKIGLWMQAIGAVVVLWIIFQVVYLWFNSSRLKQVHEIRKDIERIEGKIDKVLKQKLKKK